MTYQTLLAEKDPRGVLTIRLNRVEVRNAFNEVLIRELSEVFAREALDPSVRAVVLRGQGPTFCAGGDLHWMRKAVDFDYSENLKDTRDLARMFAQLNEFPKPLIGAIQGAAIGGGVGLVSVCDIAIAVENTQFSLSEVRLGIVPACIGPFVVAKIGASHARGLFVSADRFNAIRAREIGLVHSTVSDEAALEAEVQRVLGNILQCGPGAMAVAKKLVLDLTWPERRANLEDSLEYVASTLSQLRISAEGQEGVKAFLEKRKPNWIQS